MNVDFNIKILDLVQFAFFIVTAIMFYFKGIKKVATIDAAAANFTVFRDNINALINSFESKVTQDLESLKTMMSSGLTSLQHAQSNIEKRLDSFDEKYVRKDVHDAHLQLIKAELKTLDDIKKFITGRRFRTPYKK